MSATSTATDLKALNSSLPENNCAFNGWKHPVLNSKTPFFPLILMDDGSFLLHYLGLKNKNKRK
jgi:hypothetical protein